MTPERSTGSRVTADCRKAPAGQHAGMLGRADIEPARRRDRAARQGCCGVSASAAASVAPLVKITFSGVAPTAAATSARAASTIARACRPSACTEEAFAAAPSAATIASRASGSSGAPALASR